MSHSATVKSFAKYTSCDVADALIKLDVPGGGFLPGLTLWSPHRQSGQTRIVGPAFTVKYSSTSDGNATPKGGTGHFVDSVPSGAVILISCPENTINAYWGGLTTRRAQALGAVGTVIDGRLRDLEELRELEYPVYARDVAPTPPHGALYVSEPVTISQDGQDIIIQPEDWVIGDLNGVVCVPKRLVERTLELMRSLAETEKAMTAAIVNGASMTEAAKLWRNS
ncbi:ribonuclease e inhibitor rraa dimethylmenaquinone methyltransferase [Colletotrichum kahawae]|uniref:Ribonuclease e inhibitor rraa dimethylmenaquinone methyltransferase n=1 Tax=Colletotrichum kahawae TaxID=34407 RepID=A0AAE0DEH5_COLKA|nr:ribonuclease e inhibitor rraa dimethylmenaquinone methyltransferase [Colletotrichum kahawae]